MTFGKFSDVKTKPQEVHHVLDIVYEQSGSFAKEQVFKKVKNEWENNIGSRDACNTTDDGNNGRLGYRVPYQVNR